MRFLVISVYMVRNFPSVFPRNRQDHRVSYSVRRHHLLLLNCGVYIWRLAGVKRYAQATHRIDFRDDVEACVNDAPIPNEYQCNLHSDGLT